MTDKPWLVTGILETWWDPRKPPVYTLPQNAMVHRAFQQRRKHCDDLLLKLPCTSPGTARDMIAVFRSLGLLNVKMEVTGHDEPPTTNS